MELNIMAIVVATVVQFIIGGVWYMGIFGTLWGEIHGFNALTKEAQQKAQQHMRPLLFVQFGLTVMTTFVLALLMTGLPTQWSGYGLAGFVWLGFVLPAQVSAVIFGGTEPKWVIKKIAVSTGASLVSLLAAAAVLMYL